MREVVSERCVGRGGGKDRRKQEGQREREKKTERE